MVALRLLVLLEERAVQLQSSSEMVKGLLIVLVVEVGLAELSVRLNQDK